MQCCRRSTDTSHRWHGHPALSHPAHRLDAQRGCRIAQPQEIGRHVGSDSFPSVSGPRAASGKERPESGRTVPVPTHRARPHRRITSMTPHHRHITPAMDRQSCTAAAAPSVAAADTWGIRPVARPQRMLAVTMAIHNTVIAMRSPPLLLLPLCVGRAGICALRGRNPLMFCSMQARFTTAEKSKKHTLFPAVRSSAL